jgi:hypothetical protein
LQNQQVTPLILQLRAIEKWNGNLPTYYIVGSGSQPVFNIPIGEIVK